MAGLVRRRAQQALQFVNWNANSLVGDRMHETAGEFCLADLIAVQGTRLRAAQQHPLRCMSTPTHKV
jgi:hypothetical protein